MQRSVSRRQCLLGLSAVAIGTSTQAAQSRAVPDLRRATALDLASGLRSGEWSACEITQYYLKRIEALNGELGRYDDNGALNAYIRTYPDLAQWACAREQGNRSSWSGIPVTLKDVFAVQNLPVTVGTPAFLSYRPSRDCELWRKWHEAGAILLGHTQSQRFISGQTTPQTANPWNPRLIVGGSSGGSAAAIAAGLAPVALGSDTNGSLIHPAACCAVTTLKPSHGLLSLTGAYPGQPSFDVAGPLARSAADCAWVLATLAGVDPEDPYTAAQRGQTLSWPVGRASATQDERPLRGLRLLIASKGGYSSWSSSGDPGSFVDPDARIRRGFENFLHSLEALGAEVVPTVMPPDLGRFGPFRSERDVRFGNRSARRFLAIADTVSRSVPVRYRWLERASEEERAVALKWYGGDTGRLESNDLIAGAKLLTPDNLQVAMEARQTLRAQWRSLLDRNRCDAFAYFEIGSPLPERRGIGDTPPIAACQHDVVPNDLGWPVLSLPVARADGLDVPISAQILAPRWHDPQLLSWGMIWQQRHPDLAMPVPADPGRHPG